MSKKDPTGTDDRRPPRNLQEEIGKRYPFDSPAQEAFLNLLRTAEHLSDGLRAILSARGLSQPQYNALRIIAARGDEGIPSQAIAQDMIHRDPDLTRLIDRLEKAGYVERRRCAEDRRRVLVFLTPDGHALVDELRQPMHDKHREQLAHMSKAKLEQLSTLLFEARHPPD